MTMASKRLMSLLTTPSKIAMALDWRKVSAKVLTLGIHQDHIGLTLATHPSFAGSNNNNASAAEVLADLPLTKRGDWTPEALKRLASIVEENRVCGLVVNWPIQQDTGRMGAACGRVLHTLEDLIAKDSDLVSSKRPVCLWDGAHAQSEPVDAWGRCASFGRATDKTEHRASVEQYHEDERMAASSVWQDFCQVHWPKACQQQQQQQSLDLSTANTSKSMLAWSKASKKYASQSQ